MNEINKSNIGILIVDDEPANILLLTKILEIEGYANIVSTHDPLQVSSLCQEHNFSIILLDLNMPEMNGYEVLDSLKTISGFASMQVIASSGDTSANSIKKALDAGFCDFITKPMLMADTLKIVNKALRNSI